LFCFDASFPLSGAALLFFLAAMIEPAFVPENNTAVPERPQTPVSHDGILLKELRLLAIVQ
jgi:hypothetical protein